MEKFKVVSVENIKLYAAQNCVVQYATEAI